MKSMEVFYCLNKYDYKISGMIVVVMYITNIIIFILKNDIAFKLIKNTTIPNKSISFIFTLKRIYRIH